MMILKLYMAQESSGGGEAEKPLPIKKLKSLSVTERRDWNDLLDNMQSDGVGGHKDLDQTDKNVGGGYIEKYKKENPNSSVDAEMVERVKNDHQQLRTGESFAEMTPEQTRILRKQMNPEFLNRVVPEGSAFGSAISRMYYPEFKKGDKSYGTDAEAYFKDFATKPKDGEGGGSEKTGSPKEGIIPHPNYEDSKSRSNYLSQWAKKYGDLQGRGDTVLKVNEVPRGASGPIKEVATKAAKQYGIDPALLYSSFMEEGGSGLFKNKDGTDTRHRKPGEYGYQAFYGDKEFPINGNESLGMPNFNQVFPDLVSKGYLPKDFKEKFRGKDGEFSGNDFKTLDDGLKAKAAWMKMSYDEVDAYAKEKGIELSKKAKDFFALADFNSGENFKKILKRYNDEGLLKDDKFLKEHPHKDEKIEEKDDVWAHVQRRLYMANNLKKEKHFEDGDTHQYN